MVTRWYRFGYRKHECGAEVSAQFRCALKPISFQTKAKPSFLESAPGGRPVWRRACISVWQQGFGRHTSPKVNQQTRNPGSLDELRGSEKHRLPKGESL